MKSILWAILCTCRGAVFTTHASTRERSWVKLSLFRDYCLFITPLAITGCAILPMPRDKSQITEALRMWWKRRMAVPCTREAARQIFTDFVLITTSGARGEEMYERPSTLPQTFLLILPHENCCFGLLSQKPWRCWEAEPLNKQHLLNARASECGSDF